MKHDPLSVEHQEAIDFFRNQNGRTWKSALRSCWSKANYPNTPDNHAAALQQLRNSHGPEWLMQYRATAVTTATLNDGPHQNPDYNIIQDTNPRSWSVINGQRAPGGYPAYPYEVMKENLDRESAIRLADTLQKMKESPLIIYNPAKDPLTGQAVVFWDKEKKELMSGWFDYTLDEYKAKYPLTQVVTTRELEPIIEKAAITQPQPITAAAFEDALECLPPAYMASGANTESFQMSERYTGRVTGTYVRIGDDHYRFNDIMGKPHAELVQKVKDSLPYQVRYEINVTPKTLAKMPQKILDQFAQKIPNFITKAYNEAKPDNSPFYPVVILKNDPANENLWAIKGDFPLDVKTAAFAALDNGLYGKLPGHRDWVKLIGEGWPLPLLRVEFDADMTDPYFLTADGEIHRLTQDNGGIEGATASAGTSEELIAVLFYSKDHSPDAVNDYQEEKEIFLQECEENMLGFKNKIGWQDCDRFTEVVDEMKNQINNKHKHS